MKNPKNDSITGLGPNKFENVAHLAPRMKSVASMHAVPQGGNVDKIVLAASQTSNASHNKCIEMCKEGATTLLNTVVNDQTLEPGKRDKYLNATRWFIEKAHKKDTEQKGFALATLGIIVGGGLGLAALFKGRAD